MAKHQRKNAASNTQVGIDFEKLTMDYFKRSIPDLTMPYWIPIGHIKQKEHKFDLGSSERKVIIECKSHTWTKGGNVPSAKLTTWDQAMLYFFLAPRGYRKIFVVKRDLNPKNKESLAAYYIRTHSHVIPDEVEFWEAVEQTGKLKKIDFDLTKHFKGKPNYSK